MHYFESGTICRSSLDGTEATETTRMLERTNLALSTSTTIYQSKYSFNATIKSI